MKQCCRQVCCSHTGGCLSTMPAPSTAPQVTYTCPTPSVIIHHLPGILLSALPYILFLTIYAINPHLHILLTSADAPTARLCNVSEWESHIIPFSVHRWVSSMNCTVLDLVSTVPYMMHYVIPVLFPVYLAITDRWNNIPRFYRLLGFAMWGHYFIWYLLPTAPPWAYAYLTTASNIGVNAGSSIASGVVQTGALAANARHLTAVASGTGGSASGLPLVDLSHREGAAFARVDAYTGLPFFYNMFSGNPVPFAAFPSGHVTWPMCILMIGPPGGRARFAWYVLLVIWATLYSSHHYLFDALGAILLVISTHHVIEWWTAERASVSFRALWRLIFQWRHLTNETKLGSKTMMNGHAHNGHAHNGKASYGHSESTEKLLPV